MAGTKRQLQITFRTTALDLTARRRLSSTPSDTLTARIRRRDFHSTTRKSITEDVAHVVPNLVCVEVVAEDCLAHIGLEKAAFEWADLQCDAAREFVAAETLAIGSVLGDGLLVADAAPNRPEVDGLVALIRHDCATERLSARCERKRCESESSKQHSRQM